MILITGCGKGIGREALSFYLHNSKETVFGVYRSTIDNDEELARYHSRMHLIKGDVRNEHLFENIFQRCYDSCSKYPDKFLVNAGMRLRSKVEDTPQKDINDIWNINYFALRNLIKTNIKFKNVDNVALVYISSIVSSMGFENLDDYGATKAASESLIRSIAVRFPQSRFNCISPGFTKTSYATNFKEKNKELYDWTISRTPMRRWGESLEIVNLIKFLLGNESSFITGQNFNADGGWSINA